MGIDVFREAASGLIVPDALSRAQETWMPDDWKRVKRALQFLGERGLAVVMRCSQAECRTSPLETLTNEAGELVLRCPHRDRVIRRG